MRKLARCAKYPALVVAEVFEELARSDQSLWQIMAARGYSLRAYRNFVSAVWHRRPDWRAAYLLARKARVMRSTTRLLDLDDEQLLALGKSGLRKAMHQVEGTRPMVERRAAAAADRSARAAVDPLYAARLRVKRRGR
jgi:hypothetical protein